LLRQRGDAGIKISGRPRKVTQAEGYGWRALLFKGKRTMNRTQTIKFKLSTILLALNFVIVASVVNFANPHTVTAAPQPADIPGDLVTFSVHNGDTLVKSSTASGVNPIPITGLAPGEKIKMIDSLPGGDKFLALSDKGNIHVIDSSGQATKMVSFPFLNTLDLSDIDYDPVKDQVIVIEKNGHRVVFDEKTRTIESLRPPEYGDGDPNKGKKPNLTGLAYDNTIEGSTNTTAYVIDSAQNTLAKVNEATSKLETVGNLMVDASKPVGFDIQPLTNDAYALLTPPGQMNPDLYNINLETGQATKIADLEGPAEGLAVAGPPLKGLTCVLTPPKATNPVGTEHTVKVMTFANGEQVVSGVIVEFSVISGPNKGMDQLVGGSTFTYHSNRSPGVDIIEASVHIGTDRATCTARKEWVNKPHVNEVKKDDKNLTTKGFFDLNAQNTILVNGNEQATKTISETELFSKKGGKKAKDGAEIKIIGGGNQSNVFIFGQTVPDLDCVMGPPMATNKLGQTHQVDLLIFARGQEVFDQNNVKDLSVKVLMGPNAGRALNPLSGNKSFTFTSQKEGVDVIEVKGSFEGRSFSCRAFKRWIKP
jgi:uncharacterized protein DUF4394